MSHITLIRHGQANSHAQTEDDYDRLSPLGQQQAAWLGTYLRDTHSHHTRLYSGTLRRHQQTAAAMDMGMDCHEDPRLNEIEYFTMSQALEAEHGISAPREPADFVHHFPKVLGAWQDGIIEGAPETFSDFETRIRDVMAEIGSGDGPALVVTSGAVIAMSMRLHLGLDIPAMCNVSLSIMNASMHRLHPIGGMWSPVMFNAVPHLEHPERHHAQTHV
ncbi:histidine phosphatase family protein [Aliishimia ponticola]|uniref:Histidine phosphatase family protein n=1 Tax=Aliishimia ponticola TaxID=2499833 RepID=A0A4S4NE07_9RHOB|nr:histidine phosphatase family protein [Aliishimia ponticola]THH36777.1 histidine phosphatase family protein [Aliishimia ponticola]